ncbi:MAG: RsmE family RNA methyltransferase [Nitrospirota bacterium]
MPTFHLSHPLSPGAAAAFTAADAHHLRDVLRVRCGDPLTVCAAGEYWQAVIDTVDGHIVTARAVAPVPAPWHSPLPVYLYQAVPKGKGIEMVIQHASELGAAVLAPLITERTIGRRADRPGRQRARWEAVAEAAQRQCGRPRLLEVRAVQTLPEALAELAGALVAVPGAPPIALPAGADAVRVVIGPEGGLSPDEQMRLTECGAHPFGVPAFTLRAATATAAVLAVVNQEVARIAATRRTSQRG